MFSLKRKKKAVVVGIAHRILLSSYYFLRSSKEAFSHLLKKFKNLIGRVLTFCSPFLSFVVINGTKTYLFANSRASKSKSKNTNNEGREGAVEKRRILDEEREKHHHRHRYFHKHK